MPDTPHTPEMPEQIGFVFKYATDYRIVACNGVWGGITPRGSDLMMDFFVESQAIPERVTNKIHDLKLGDEIERVPPKHFVREVQVSVLLPLSQMESLVGWLQERVEQAKRLNGAQQ